MNKMAMTNKTTVITAGDPAGIGPDLCLDILNGDGPPLTVIGDRDVLAERAELCGVPFAAAEYDETGAGHRSVWHCPAGKVECGKLSADNAPHVLEQLNIAVQGCLSGKFNALITAPVSKQTICQSGLEFKGQTEYIAERANVAHPVMLLAGGKLKVALATRHLPLSQVAGALSANAIFQTLQTLNAGLQKHFKLNAPVIAVAGLNPHAGEGGFLGSEEAQIISPAIAQAVQAGIRASGPFAADSMFATENADCYLAMYHDQGLPVIKYAEFEHAVNATLGLPFLRTSPDHGTAQSLAGTGKASPNSMRAAARLAFAAGKE